MSTSNANTDYLKNLEFSLSLLLEKTNPEQ